MEGKSFIEVFTELQDNEKIVSAFQDVIVKRVVLKKKRRLILVYIGSQRIIHKSDIYMAEQAISELLDGARIKIIERFYLSTQYNSENLYQMYRDSLMMEIYQHSPLEYSVLKKADIQFQEDVMMIKLKESVISTDKSKDLKEILEKVFNERCGVATEVRYEFIETKEESKFKEYNEAKLQQEVAAIINGANLNSDKKDDSFMDAQPTQKSDKKDKSAKENKQAVSEQKK